MRIRKTQRAEMSQPIPPAWRSTPEIEQIIADPQGWLHRELRKSRKKYDDEYWYLVTFTRNPNSRYSIPEMLNRVAKELERSSIVEHFCMPEHMDSNIHVHAAIRFTTPHQKERTFKVYMRDYGYVDMRRINVNNGVADYLLKDCPPNTRLMTSVDLQRLASEGAGEQL